MLGENIREHASYWNDVVTGIIAGVLFLGWRVAEDRKREAETTRWREIAELNHHVRNALQVITFTIQNSGAMAVTDSEAEKQRQVMRESIQRIDQALRKISLPENFPKEPLAEILEKINPR